MYRVEKLFERLIMKKNADSKVAPSFISPQTKWEHTNLVSSPLLQDVSQRREQYPRVFVDNQRQCCNRILPLIQKIGRAEAPWVLSGEIKYFFTEKL